MKTLAHFDSSDFLRALVHNAMRPSARPAALMGNAHLARRSIAMDVIDLPTGYRIVADLPGMRKEDVGVTIDGCCVTITAQRSAMQHRQSETQSADQAAAMPAPAPRSLLSERFVGQWGRTIELPEEIDNATAQAKYQDGVLELNLTKIKPRGTKTIAVE